VTLSEPGEWLVEKHGTRKWIPVDDRTSRYPDRCHKPDPFQMT